LFLQDNAVPHKAAIKYKKLIDLHSEVLKHLAYTPDLAPSDYCHFPNLKEHAKGRTFSSNDEPHQQRTVCSTTNGIFLGWFEEVRTRSHKRVELKRECAE
jgi:hypothetical protein